MGTEIERKFLVTGPAWGPADKAVVIRQGYISRTAGRTVRVRVAGAQAFITLKGERRGLSRAEFEYEIPLADGAALLTTLCQPALVEKVRHYVQVAGLIWEVDEFTGANAGLVVAEIELEREDQPLALPAWAGAEVSTDYHYTNAYLSEHPFTGWPP